jgi:hypothetical protein
MWTQVLETSADQMQEVRRQYTRRSRNFDLWTRASKHLPVTPVDQWLATYKGALPAAAYTTTALLGEGYSVERQLFDFLSLGDSGRRGNAGRNQHSDDDPSSTQRQLRKVLLLEGNATRGVTPPEERFLEAKRALESLLAPEQPEVCQRITRLCVEGPTRLLCVSHSSLCYGQRVGLRFLRVIVSPLQHSSNRVALL